MSTLGGASELLLDLLHFTYESTFGHYGSLYHFMLAWIVLFDLALYMGMAMLKGTRKYVSMFFGIVHKSVQSVSWRGT